MVPNEILIAPKLRAPRAYVNAAALLSDITARLGAGTDIRLEPKTMIAGPVRLVSAADNHEVLAVFSHELGGVRATWFVVPFPGGPPLETVADPEPAVLARMRHVDEGAEIDLAEGGPFDFWDAAVAGAKQLVLSRYHAHGRRLVFTGLAARRQPRAGPIRVEIVKALAGRYFVLRYLLDGAAVAEGECIYR